MPRMQESPGVAEAKTPTNTIATVERAADLLLHMAASRGPDFGITELADDLDMSKAAVHRMLATLKLKGLVSLDPRTRRYALGVGTLRLGLAYLDRIDVRRMARPAMEKLSESTGETTTLSVLLGEQQRIYVDQVTPDREVIMSVTIGEPYPLHAGASGRTFLAHLGLEAMENYLSDSPLQRLTDSTVIDVAKMRTSLGDVRGQGWAVSDGERKGGAAAIAAPVLNHVGFPVAVVSVCGPRERLLNNLDQCRDELLEVTQDLSGRFGWQSL